MDIGVGSFVFSSGVVSGRAYANPSQQQKNFFVKSILNSLRSSFALLTLGFIRLISTKSVNYQEHNSEYGLHWNFFFTLGLLPPFTAIAASLSQLIPFSVMALSTAIGAVIYWVSDWYLCMSLTNWMLCRLSSNTRSWITRMDFERTTHRSTKRK